MFLKHYFYGLVTPNDCVRLNKRPRAFRFEQNVYFFSHEGHMFELEKGSTLLDFAYDLHTDLGNRFKSALVNGSEKAIHYSLQEGDIIKIITSRNQTVSSKWLKYINNKATQKKILSSLRRQNFQSQAPAHI